MWTAIGLPWCSAEGQIHIHEGILLLYFSLHNNFSTMDAHWDDMNFSCLLSRKKFTGFRPASESYAAREAFGYQARHVIVLLSLKRWGMKFYSTCPASKYHYLDCITRTNSASSPFLPLCSSCGVYYAKIKRSAHGYILNSWLFCLVI
jgi:hypothetical protein